MQQQWIISWLDCDMWQKVDFTWQLEMTSSVVVLRSSKFFPKPNLHPKNVMITVWWSAAALIHYCFLNPSETIIDVYSANLWNSLQTERPTASTDQQKGPSSSPWQHPNTCCTTNDSKVEQTGLWNLASCALLSWPLVNELPFLQASWQIFAGKMFP